MYSSFNAVTAGEMLPGFTEVQQGAGLGLSGLSGPRP